MLTDKTIAEKLDELLYPVDIKDCHSAIDWGKTHEEKAREDFKLLTGLKASS